MTDHSPIITLPQSSYTIKEAAALVGKSDITLVRWCRDDVFPNAGKVPGPKGDEWSIPATDLASIIAAKNLTIDLAQSETDDARSSDRADEELIELREENATLIEKTGHLTGQNTQLTDQVSQLRNDLEHAQGEWHRSETDRAEAVGRAEVLQAELEKAQLAAKDAAQERDSLDQQHRELEKTSAESLSALSNDLDDVRSSLENAENDVKRAVGERDELAAKAQKLEGSLGWWARRKYQR